MADYKKGDRVRIIDNISCHGFDIGEEVVLLNVTDDEFSAINDANDSYFIFEEEVEPI
jgi:hypothetical protein